MVILIRRNKAKAGAEVRIRKRGGAIRIRTRKAGRRAVRRSPAKEHAPKSFSGGWYVGIEVVAEVCISARACSYGGRHVLAVFSYHHRLNVAIAPGEVASLVVVGQVGVGASKERRVVAGVEYRAAAGVVALNKAEAAVRLAPNMAEGVFYTSV